MNISNDNSIRYVINNKIRESLGVTDDICENQDLTSVGLDSIKIISLISTLEDEFDILFDDDELLMYNFSTIKIITDRVNNKMEKSDEESQVIV